MPALDVNSLRGKLVVETSSMNGSKTEQLVRYAQNIAEHTPFRVIAVTNDVNTRDEPDKIVSNGGFLTFPARQIQANRPESLLEMIAEEDRSGFVDVVAIDEGNFYDHRIIPILRQLREQRRVIVIAGLDLNFRGEPFRPMNRIIELADVVNRHHPYCKIQRDGKQCSNLAKYTVRVKKSSPHKLIFYDTDGHELEGFGFAPYFDPTILPEGSSKDVKYTVACESCFKIPRKDDAIRCQQALLRGKMPWDVVDIEAIIEFFLKENIFYYQDGKLMPVPYTYDIASGMHIPMRK